VTNIGGSPGSYTVNLTLNGNLIGSKTVTLNPGESTVVAFTISINETGTYTIGVNGLTTSLTVKKEVGPAPSTILYIAIAVIIIVIAVAFIILHKRGR